MTNNSYRNWQEKLILAERLSNLMADYEFRKSKLIKFVPTEKELREAMRLYKSILDMADTGDKEVLKLKKILDSISEIPEEQIKFVGFMDEILKKYPKGVVPNQFLMDKAEKWDVLEYILEDIVTALGINLK